MKLLFEPQDLLISWICTQLDIFPSTDMRAIGVLDKENTLIGVVAYHNWTGTACEMHMAGDKGWLTREVIRRAFDYPFRVGGCKKVLAFVPSGYTKALDIDHRLGFKTEHIIEDAHPDGGIHILSMRREDCRWLTERTHHGKEESTAAA